jgi:phage shock protein PspC (stress-responsive transcriptional regulator)
MAAAARPGSLGVMSEQENAGGWGAGGSRPQSEPEQGPGPVAGSTGAEGGTGGTGDGGTGSAGPTGPGWGAGTGAGWGSAAAQRPPLRRERRSRMIAGVCGGLGRYLDIDPVVFRILFVMLTFFGGFGLLAYAAAWLFVPADGEAESEAHKLLTGRSALAAVAVAVLLVLGFMAMVSTLSDGFRRAVPLLVLATAIVTILVWRGEERRQQPPGQAAYTAGGWDPNGPEPRPWWQRPVPTSPAPGTTGAGTTGTGTAGMGAAGTGAMPPADAGTRPDPGPPYSGATPYAAPPPEPVSRPRRISGLTLSGALLALGVIGVLASAGAIHIGITAGFALAVMAVGAGMMIGGLFGRARTLIPVGLVLAVPLIVAGALGAPLRGQTGDIAWTPASAASLDSPYELAAGHGSLDLSSVHPNGGTVHVSAHVGAGELIVTVPDNVEVRLTGHVGLGSISFLNASRWSAADSTKTFDSPAAGTPNGTIVLDLAVGLGNLEVDRVNG